MTLKKNTFKGDYFFWNDYSGDVGLAMCSFAAQGLWMRMLCIMGQAPRKGFLMLSNERPLRSPEEIARAVGHAVDEVLPLLRELVDNSVYSTDRHGTIYCRRMLREEQKVQKSRKGGKKGGRVTYEKQRGIFATQGPTQEGTQGPTQAPTPPHPTKKKNTDRVVLPAARPNGFYKNGSGGKDRGTTIKDPNERLARFQNWLAKELGRDGWTLVAAAVDPASPQHERALAICREQTVRSGKGWPQQWPGGG